MAKMTYSVGDVFFRAGITDEGEAYVDEWHLRTIRAGKAYITQKIDGGNFSKGKWDDNIPDWCRKKFSVEPKGSWDRLDDDFAKSRAAAIAIALRKSVSLLDEIKAENHPDDADFIAAMEKGLRTLKGFLTKTKNQAAKKKAANAAKRADQSAVPLDAQAIADMAAARRVS